ncbi:MAG TPA: hypothetical protein VII49_10445 [Rhizomicrobium sp.]
MQSRYIALAVALLLSACSTPYQEMGLLGGVSATQVSSDTMSITAKGNGFTGADTVKNYALLKAADETIAHGFDYFALGDATDESRHGAYSWASGSATRNSWFGSGFSTEMIKPGENVLIKMYHGMKPAEAPDNYFDAHDIENYLGKSIRRD